MSLFRTLLSQLQSGGLPKEYQQVEWIKNDGNSYINLDISASGGILCDHEIEYGTDYASLNVDGGGAIMAHGASYPYGRCTGYYKAGISSWELGYGEIYPDVRGTMVYNHKYHIEYCTFYDEAYLDVDGVRIITQSGQNVTNTNVYVFSNYGAIANNWKNPIIKLYNGKIYKKINNVLTLVRDLIPCYRKSDNAIGLYDLVENKFYGNDGTGKFICYPKPPHGLPGEYQEVEWIKGSGSQYINTGYVATGGMTCEFDVTYESDYTTYNSNGGYIIGSHAPNYPYGRSGAWYVKGDKKWQLGYGEQTPMYSMTMVYGIPYNVKFSTIIGNAWLEVDGTRIITNTSTQTITTTPVYVFAHQYDLDHGGICTIAKLHYGKIYDSTNTLIREFIPCYRKSDNVIGLYDKVNNVFYTNNGTGTFTKGSDV